MRTFIFIALVALCGCSPSPKDIVGDWAKPMGIRTWDGRIIGEDFLIRFSADGTYRVIERAVYEDQFTTQLSDYYVGIELKSNKTGRWHLEGHKLYFDTQREKIPIILSHISSDSFEVSCPWRSDSKPFVFYRVNLTNQQVNTALNPAGVGASNSVTRITSQPAGGPAAGR